MPSGPSFALFETALGTCAIGWRGGRIAALHLPEGSAAAARSGLRRRFPAAVEEPPPALVAATVEAVRALLAGEAVDLSGTALDLDDVPAFERRVYAAALEIPSGATLTYGEVASRIGDPGAARAVGRALGRNPVPIIVPCHRVVAAGGRTGGFTAPGGADTKLRLLAIERAAPLGRPDLFAPA